MHWILTGMLIAASALTAAFTGYLVRRLFTLEPGGPEQPATSDPVVPNAQGEPA